MRMPTPASSKLSSAPTSRDTLSPSIQRTFMARKWNDSCGTSMSSYTSVEACKAEIMSAIKRDEVAIKNARSNVKTRPEFHTSTAAEQDAMIQEAALDRIKNRIGKGLHVSFEFPAFRNYIPPVALGKQGKGTVDHEKDRCMDAQLELLQGPPARKQRARYDDNEDDEELIPIKKQEGEVKQEFSDAPAYDGKQEAQSSPESEETQHTIKATIGNKRKRADKSDDEDSDDDDECGKVVTWHAISRGMPLACNLSMPKLADVNLKQRFATSTTPCFERAVFRGQVPILDDSDEN